VKVYGSMELVKSDWLELQSTVCADPPAISVAVIGLDERRQLEHNICDLINKRDRLLTLLIIHFLDLFSVRFLADNIRVRTLNFSVFFICRTMFCRLINLVAKGVTSVTDVLSKVEALLDDYLTTVRVQYAGRQISSKDFY